MGLCRQLNFMAHHLFNLQKNVANRLSKMLSATAQQHLHRINKVLLELQNQKGRSALHSLVAPILLVSLRNLGHCTAGITSPKASLSHLFKVRSLKQPERKQVEFYFKSCCKRKTLLTSRAEHYQLSLNLLLVIFFEPVVTYPCFL